MYGYPMYVQFFLLKKNLEIHSGYGPPDGMTCVGGQLVKPKVPACPTDPQTSFCNYSWPGAAEIGTGYFPPGKLGIKTG